MARTCRRCAWSPAASSQKNARLEKICLTFMRARPACNKPQTAFSTARKRLPFPTLPTVTVTASPWKMGRSGSSTENPPPPATNYPNSTATRFYRKERKDGFHGFNRGKAAGFRVSGLHGHSGLR